MSLSARGSARTGPIVVSGLEGRQSAFKRVMCDPGHLTPQTASEGLSPAGTASQLQGHGAFWVQHPELTAQGLHYTKTSYVTPARCTSVKFSYVRVLFPADYTSHKQQIRAALSQGNLILICKKRGLGLIKTYTSKIYPCN